MKKIESGMIMGVISFTIRFKASVKDISFLNVLSFIRYSNSRNKTYIIIEQLHTRKKSRIYNCNSGNYTSTPKYIDNCYDLVYVE